MKIEKFSDFKIGDKFQLFKHGNLIFNRTYLVKNNITCVLFDVFDEKNLIVASNNKLFNSNFYNLIDYHGYEFRRVIENPCAEIALKDTNFKQYTNSCNHSTKYKNHAGGTLFWYCPACKSDLGDVK